MARLSPVPERDPSPARGSSGALARGDAAAFAELLEDHWLPLVRYAMRLLGTRDLAEDAVQDAFVRLWEKRTRIDPKRPVQSYLYRILRNRVLDEVRRERFRDARTPLLKAAAAVPPTPSQVTEAEDLECAAARAIDALPQRRREVFVLAHLNNLSYKEIAQIMQITPRTVANHMSLALSELRSVLQPFVDDRLGPR